MKFPSSFPFAQRNGDFLSGLRYVLQVSRLDSDGGGYHHDEPAISASCRALILSKISSRCWINSEAQRANKQTRSANASSNCRSGARPSDIGKGGAQTSSPEALDPLWADFSLGAFSFFSLGCFAGRSGRLLLRACRRRLWELQLVRMTWC